LRGGAVAILQLYDTANVTSVVTTYLVNIVRLLRCGHDDH